MIQIVYHECALTKAPCRPGSTFHCPKELGPVIPSCPYFLYRGPRDESEDHKD